MSTFDADALHKELVAIMGDDAVARDVALAELTTFRVGGPVTLLAEPGSLEEAVAAVACCTAAGAPLRIIGCGSNILASDAGLDCVLLRFGERLSEITCNGTQLCAMAGATNKQVAQAALEAGLTGYEFASGIPGTLGGAAIMNAGAYDGEFKDVAIRISCCDALGKLIHLTNEEACFGYRSSKMMTQGLIVLAATLQLETGDSAVIQERMDELKARREEKQPLELPSAGSTFKRPEGYFAGKLIQDAGLKGHRVGGAQVSPKHSGFVVNAGGATAADVRQLIREVQERVFQMEGVRLEPEVRMWGFDTEL
ncbi:MAG: UDP-N-acetylmuramate dehydrogenase [Coriobacteriales bacterium]